MRGTKKTGLDRWKEAGLYPPVLDSGASWSQLVALAGLFCFFFFTGRTPAPKIGFFDARNSPPYGFCPPFCFYCPGQF